MAPLGSHSVTSPPPCTEQNAQELASLAQQPQKMLVETVKQRDATVASLRREVAKLREGLQRAEMTAKREAELRDTMQVQ